MKKHSIQFYIFITLIVVYLVTLFVAKPDDALIDHYHLTASHFQLIYLTVAIPLIIIWLIGYYGYAKLARYAQLIPKKDGGWAVRHLSQGLMVLVFQQPVISIIHSVFISIAQNQPQFVPVGAVVLHYLEVALPLVAFILISYGARGLLRSLNVYPSYRSFTLMAVIFTIVGAGFTYLLFKVPDHPLIANSLSDPAFYLPNSLLFFTVAVPSIYMWILGGFSALETFIFGQNVAGIIFRQGWKFVGGGLAMVIGFSIITEYLTILSNHLFSLYFNGLLVAVYLLLVAMALGYVLIAIGAKQLRKIEEV